MLSVEAVIVTVPSGSVMPDRVALPLLSRAATPSGAAPRENEMLPLVMGRPFTRALTVKEPCQPLTFMSASAMQPGATEPAGHSLFAAVGLVKITTGAMPAMMVQGMGCIAVVLPAVSVATPA